MCALYGLVPQDRDIELPDSFVQYYNAKAQWVDKGPSKEFLQIHRKWTIKKSIQENNTADIEKYRLRLRDIDNLMYDHICSGQT